MLHLSTVQRRTMMNKFQSFWAEFQLKHAERWIILVVNPKKSPSAKGSARIPPYLRQLEDLEASSPSPPFRLDD